MGRWGQPGSFVRTQVRPSSFLEHLQCAVKHFENECVLFSQQPCDMGTLIPTVQRKKLRLHRASGSVSGALHLVTSGPSLWVWVSEMIGRASGIDERGVLSGG